MAELHVELPQYGFDEHKGYCTPAHTAALTEHGPSAVHRFSYVNVAEAARAHGMRAPRRVARPMPGIVKPGVVQNGLLPAQSTGDAGTVERGGARVR
jgi:ribonuclease HII